MRDEEDTYATSVVHDVRSAYRRGVACTMKGCSKEAQRQLRAQTEAAEAKLDTCRAAAAAAAAQAVAAERRRGEADATMRCAQARAFCIETAIGDRIEFLGFSFRQDTRNAL